MEANLPYLPPYFRKSLAPPANAVPPAIALPLLSQADKAMFANDCAEYCVIAEGFLDQPKKKAIAS